MEDISIRQKRGNPLFTFFCPWEKRKRMVKAHFAESSRGFLKLPFSLNFTLEHLGPAGPRQFRDA